MKDLKNLIILGLFIWIVLLFTCNKPKVETEVVTKTVTRVDSIYTTDTIIDTFKVEIASVPITDTIYISDSLSTYIYAKEDSLIKYEIEVDSESQPKDVRIKYDINQFTIRDSIYIRDSSHVKEVIKKSYIAAGLIMPLGTSGVGFAPSLSYVHKSGNNYLVGYDLIDKRLMLGFSKRISFNRSHDK